MLAKVVVPFMKAVPPDYKEVFDMIEKITEVYDEHAMEYTKTNVRFTW